MARPPCQVCGCTEDHPCEFGCQGVGQEQTHCSQCVCWASLAKPNPFEGILPYDLLPVRTLYPTASNNASGLSFPVDHRRMDQETRERLAFTLAPPLGITVDELLEDIEVGGFCAAAIPAEKVVLIQVAQTVEVAAARVEEFHATGKIAAGGRRIEIGVPVPIKFGGPQR